MLDLATTVHVLHVFWYRSTGTCMLYRYLPVPTGTCTAENLSELTEELLSRKFRICRPGRRGGKMKFSRLISPTMSTPNAAPTPGTCVAHGHISLAKTKSFFSRKFKPAYWTIVWPTTVIVFVSKKDFALWLSSPQRGNGVTSLAVDVLDSSVKAVLNLDPSGIVQRRERKQRKRLEKEASRKEKKEKSKSSSSKSKSNGSAKEDKKRKTKSAGEAAADAAARYAESYSLAPVQFSDKDQMHVLNVEKTTRTGSSVALCVGSKDPWEVESLREALESILALINGDEARCKFITPALAAAATISAPKKEIVNTVGRPPRPMCTPKLQPPIAREALVSDGSPDDSFESFYTSLSAPLPCIAESTAGSETRSAVSAAS